MATHASAAEVEVKELKDKFSDDFHVIRNVGDFSHVVSISFNKWCIKLKFQITGITQSFPFTALTIGLAMGRASSL